MGKNRRNLTLRVRFKNDLGIKSKLVVGKGKKKAKGFGASKILRVEKVSKNELYHMGEYNDMPQRLMKEFKNGKNGNGNGKKSMDELLDTVAAENKKTKV